MASSNIGYIYIATNNINDKIYVGKTNNFNRRIIEHRNDTPNKNYKFGRAINKYGFDNFKFEIIYTFKSKNLSTLNLLLSIFEKSLIKKYDSFNNGYNSTLGGDGIIGRKHTEDTKNKMSISAKIYAQSEEGKISHSVRQIGKVVTQETKGKQSLAKIGKPSTFLNKKHSNESKEKMRNSTLGQVVSLETKLKKSQSMKDKWASGTFIRKSTKGIQRKNKKEMEVNNA